jgi:hypothetical protein
MRIKNSLHFVALSFAIGCTPYVAPLPDSQLPESRPEPVHIEVLQPQKKSNLTFIDTLNRGKEIVLSENDFTSPPVAMAGNNTASTVQYESVPHFRVQVFASSQSERLKEDKKKLEKQFAVPVIISFESPLYKLYAGDFSQRIGADTLLAKIKKIGYQDAWVVSTKNNYKQ